MHPREGDREDKERGPKFEPKVHKPKGVIRGKRTNYVPKPPPIIRSILEKEREGNLESIVNLKELLPAIMAHLKIKVVCAFYKPTDTFNL
jgi:hypothetical protein